MGSTTADDCVHRRQSSPPYAAVAPREGRVCQCPALTAWWSA